MAWFQLDPESVAQRIASGGGEMRPPKRLESVVRGALGFTVVSILGFAPWALAGSWFYRNLGEAGLYAVCALVFIGAAGPLMHRLILGPGSLPRFYALFATIFTAYSAAWITGWMALGGHPGSVAGLLAGTALMGAMLARAFGCPGETLKLITALFISNAAGYFLGGILEGIVARRGAGDVPGAQMVFAKTLWGVCYGVGFGAGLGWAFHQCQAETRRRGA
jgi:hypothetical protein